jgi:iron-sulfur cluster assembly protein
MASGSWLTVTSFIHRSVKDSILLSDIPVRYENNEYITRSNKAIKRIGGNRAVRDLSFVGIFIIYIIHIKLIMKSIITLSKTALQQFRRIRKDTKTKAILFSLKGGGCNGFEYKLTPTNEELKGGDEIQIIRKNKNSENKPPSDEDIVIHICGKSLMHVIGTHIDWERDIMGEAFKFDNPMAKSSCGCGTSFTPL